MTGSGSGIVLLNKAPGITSFKAVESIRKKLNIKKAGHAGTLDKFADGLLIVLLGKYTRLAQFFSNLDKEYLATFQFGKETDTLDPEGEVIKTKPLPAYESVKKAIGKYTGVIDQIPPDYSAVHTEGKRAYKIALKGEKPKLSPRRVTIFDIEIISFVRDELKVRVVCSKGTYIRSLARDLGNEVLSCAYVKELTRTKVGNFTLKKAVDLSSFNAGEDIIKPGIFLKEISNIQVVVVENRLEQIKILHGSLLDDEIFDNRVEKDSLIGVLDGTGNLLAIVERNNGRYRYRSVFN